MSEVKTELQNGNPARTKLAIIKLKILERRAKVVDLLIRGYTKRETAWELKISERTVENDRLAIRNGFRDSSFWNYGDYAEIERQRLELISKEAWEAWERSQEPAETFTVEKDADGKLISTTIKEEERVGDGRFLEIAIRASESRRKLLGLDSSKDSPGIVNVNTIINNGDPIYLPSEQRRAIVLSLLGNAPDPFDAAAENSMAGAASNSAGNGNAAGSNATNAGKVLPTPTVAKANGHAGSNGH